ncbi:hypothetical protein G4V62_02925 [Bacillaceae bacterium SIJ1]|uniref:hypothetical protein n=1 Tax=Litoribacterium kuwaitense TaxID=1398745 RepID=UPI0013EADA17|nr:hypothetical protein [Litoribacterium kuwaitense]NGP43952.1 hypothetical protein [Litoribacterium kuwaitense]
MQRQFIGGKVLLIGFVLAVGSWSAAPSSAAETSQSAVAVEELPHGSYVDIDDMLRQSDMAENDVLVMLKQLRALAKQSDSQTDALQYFSYATEATKVISEQPSALVKAELAALVKESEQPAAFVGENHWFFVERFVTLAKKAQ